MRPGSLRSRTRTSAAWLVLLLRAVCTASAAGDDLLQDVHVRVYVADLPPKYNLHIIAKEGCEDGRFLKRVLANPLGPLYNGSLDTALYRESPYYGLEVHTHLQLLYSPLRVLTAEEADIVYVPFYGSQLWSDLSGHQDHVNNEGACKPIWTDQATDDLIADFWADAPTLLPLLGTKPHWMQLSEIEWMIYRGCDEGWGIPLGCHPLAAHMTFATPEPLTATNPWYRRQRFYGSQPSHNNSVPVPYLGHIHRVSIHHRAKLLAEEGVASKKEFLATMSFGSWRRAHLRELVAQQCQEAPGECWYMGYSSFGEVIDSYRRAWFCVHPHGDTPTRSALLDCLASGLAVPAVFDEYLADMLPFADVVDFRTILAYVPEEDIMGTGGSLLQSLKEYSNDTRMTMLENVQRVAHAFQYAVQPNHLLVRFDTLYTVHPLDDAFTMSFKAVLRHACRHTHAHHRCHHARHHEAEGYAREVG